jgi:hypothetical protein
MELRNIDLTIQKLIIEEESKRKRSVSGNNITERQKAFILDDCAKRGLDQPKDLDQWTKKEASNYISNRLRPY